MNAIVLAAGMGTRLAPLTNKYPKALIYIQGRPLLFYQLNKLRKSGFKNIIVNAHHQADMLAEYIKYYNQHYKANVQISIEEKLLDTGGGIKKMLTMFDNDQHVLIHNVDILSSLELKTFYKQHVKSQADASLAVQRRKTSRPLIFDSGARLCGKQAKDRKELLMVHPPQGAISKLAFCGIQVVDPQLFLSYIPEKFYSIDVYMKSAARGKTINGFIVDDIYWQDLGRFKDLHHADKDIKRGLILLDQLP